MSEARDTRPSRPSARSIFVAITGLGTAALVTSVSALNAGSDDEVFAVAVAVVGGTAALVISSLIALMCALRLPTGADRDFWLMAGLSVALTSAGSGSRAAEMLVGRPFVSAGTAEWVYMGGMAMLACALVSWPLRHRTELRLGTVFAEAAVSSAVGLGLAWLLLGAPILRAAAEYGGIGPNQAAQFLGFLAAIVVSAAFTLVAAANLRRRLSPGPWMALSIAVLLIVMGDLAWLADVTDASWLPGSLGDFAHISGHVLVAVGASLSLDAARHREKRSRKGLATE